MAGRDLRFRKAGESFWASANAGLSGLRRVSRPLLGKGESSMFSFCWPSKSGRDLLVFWRSLDFITEHLL
jgi:hypothetical protein